MSPAMQTTLIAFEVDLERDFGPYPPHPTL